MERFLAKLIMLGFRKLDVYYILQDIAIRPHLKTQKVFIISGHPKLQVKNKYIHYKKALPIIIELLH